MPIIPVSTSSRPYDVIVESGSLAAIGACASAKLKARNCAVITDSNVAPLYLATVQESLLASGFTVEPIEVSAGENAKSLAIGEEVADRMARSGLDRKSCVFALGGGVIGDLAGFIAAIFYRGVPVVQIPTTVTAQVDSAIGGKTGVNLPCGKNLIGAFHPPAFVFSDPATLSSLPHRELHEGFAEIIKHAVIRDSAMLENLPPAGTPPSEGLIAGNVCIKARIVSDDEFERTGERALLNFGHTIGHAVENAAGYGQLLHGEAISIGIAAACHISEQVAGLRREETDRVLALLRRYGLPTRLPPDLQRERVLEAMRRDKKFESGAIRFILTERPGTAFVSRNVTWDHIQSALDHLAA